MPATGAAYDTNHAVLLAPGVWWVGAVLADDAFQCHVYLLENGTECVLIDPGSSLTLPETLRKVEEVTALENIRWLVCHHADPDVAQGLPALRPILSREDAAVVSEWRAAALLRHYDAGFPFYLVEEHDWRLELGGRRSLEFQLTPYLHFPGAMVSYDTASRTLFSADIFGGFVLDPKRLIATHAQDAFDALRPFHEHYMPSRELLSAGLQRIRRRFPDIHQVAPQHGHVIPEPLVDEMFTRLQHLECGVFLLAEDDLDLAHLLRVAETRRRLVDALLTTHSAQALLATVTTMLSALLPVEAMAVYAVPPGEGWIRLDLASGVDGIPVPGPRPPTPHRVQLELPGSTPAIVELALASGAEPDAEVLAMLTDSTPTMALAVDRFLAARVEAREHARLEDESEHDPLTGLLNRRGLSRSLPPGPYALVLLDLDHFKDVNDTCGHEAGDEVLRRLAVTLRSTLRPHDVLARLGGEEFVVLLPGSGQGEARDLAERILDRVRAMDVAGLAPRDRVTTSAGISLRRPSARPAGECFEAALAAADAALYRAKQSGRDRVAVAP